MTEPTVEIDPRTLALLDELQTAYQDRGAVMHGLVADQYHQALTAYVKHLNLNGGAPH